MKTKWHQQYDNENFLRLVYPDHTNRIEDITKCLGYKGKSIQTKASNLGLKRDKYTPYVVNDTYFRYWSHNMAYVLGFIVADGNVPKHGYGLRINLCEKDLEVLSFIQSEIAPQAPIDPIKKITPNKTYYGYSLTINSRLLKDDLINLGVIPAKTGKEIVPPNMPDEFLWSWIRGLFDGDGCAVAGGRGEVSLISASKNLVSEIIRKTQIGVLYTQEKPKHMTIYKWSILRYRWIEVFIKRAYANGDFFLKRKHDKLLKITRQGRKSLDSCFLRDKSQPTRTFLQQSCGYEIPTKVEVEDNKDLGISDFVL